MNPLPEMEGVLKQQCTDDNGYFDWAKKRVQLDFMKSVLSLTSIASVESPTKDKPTTVSISVATAKYAKVTITRIL